MEDTGNYVPALFQILFVTSHPENYKDTWWTEKETKEQKVTANEDGKDCNMLG